MSANGELLNFNNKLDDFIHAKYLLSDVKLTGVLRAVASSELLCEIFSHALEGYDYERAKTECFKKDGVKRIFALPKKNEEILAFAFSLLVEFDEKKLDLFEICNEYFNGNASNQNSYENFCASVMIPFGETVNKVAYMVINADFSAKKDEVFAEETKGSGESVSEYGEEVKEICTFSKTIYDGRVIKVKKDEVVTSKGIKAEREVVMHNGGSAVLAVKDGKILLERQFRYALGETLWEIPAGKRDGDEEFIETAKRELEEETGLIPLDLREIFKIYPSPGYTNEPIGVFFAESFKEGKIHFDETEDLVSLWIDEETVRKMIAGGEIKDGKTLVALLWYFAKIK